MSGELDLTARLLDATALRQRAIAANLANANTPGYRRVEVRFEEAFARALEQGGPGAAAQVRPELVTDPAPGRLDGNNVESERELVDLQAASIQYGLLSRAAAAKVSLLRAAITGRGG